jgi:hypothetical protein
MPDRGVSAEWRFLQHDEASALQMPHDTRGGDGGHIFVGSMNALPALEFEREATASAKSRGSAASLCPLFDVVQARLRTDIAVTPARFQQAYHAAK